MGSCEDTAWLAMVAQNPLTMSSANDCSDKASNGHRPANSKVLLLSEDLDEGDGRSATALRQPSWGHAGSNSDDAPCEAKRIGRDGRRDLPGRSLLPARASAVGWTFGGALIGGRGGVGVTLSRSSQGVLKLPFVVCTPFDGFVCYYVQVVDERESRDLERESAIKK